MIRALWIGLCAALVTAGCASYDGRGLIAGRSTAAEVESLMGRPAMRMTKEDGGSIVYYPRGPVGRHTYAVTLGPDGVMRGIDQRLTLECINKLRVGAMTTKEVLELLGPPAPTWNSRLPRQAREVWEYKWLYYDEKRVLWIQFSDDGIVREVINIYDYEGKGGGSGK